MVIITQDIIEFINEQGVFVVGSIGTHEFCSVSPRIFFHVTEKVLYWLDFFKHKSYCNFKSNPFVSVAVFNKSKMNGFQLWGKVRFLEDPKKSTIRAEIIHRTLQSNSSKKINELSRSDAEVIEFTPSTIFSLNPEEFSNLPTGCDADPTQVLANLRSSSKYAEWKIESDPWK